MPANAAPANRNGEAATAAILDLIDIFVFVYLASNKKPADGNSPDKGVVHSTQGYDLSSPSFYVMLFSIHFLWDCVKL